MDDGLELRVFGAVEVWRDGERRPVGGPKPRLLLALLLAHCGSVVSSDRLCEELWGDDQPISPRAVLQSHASRLRRLLEPDARIVARPPGYSLEVAPERVDASRFERLVASVRDATTAGPQVLRQETVVAGLEAALALYRGLAFAEFADADWARGESVRLDEIRLSAEEDLVEALLASGDAAAAVARAEAMVVAYPLRERFWLQLMLGLYRCGRQTDALRRAETMRARLRDEAGLEPSAALRDLERRVLDEDPTLELGAGAVTVERRVVRSAPNETTRLVGRERDLDAIVGLVRRERLVTLTGPGGVGKTRLAMRVARELWQDVPDGVFVVELAPVGDAGAFRAAVAAALDVHPRQHLSLEDSLVEYLRDRRTLLVLDNCEHLLAATAPMVERLLSWCPDLNVLATSRSPLGIAGEHVWTVAPLAVAPAGADPAAAADAAAVELFVERAVAARPGFALDLENVDAVGEIVRGLDGIPLAIELAAARLRAMSPTALAQRLDQRFQLLTGASQAAQPSHRALRDLVSWSHDLLTTDERRLFRRLSLFAGGFDLDAVEDVCAFDDLAPVEIPALLADLVDKSMVQLVDADVPRYRLLETLREFGLDQLTESERETLRDRHCSWYLGVAERGAVGLAGPGEADDVARLSRDFDNLRAAHLTALERRDPDTALRLVAALREFAFRNLRSEITTWAEEAMAVRGAADHARYPVVCSVVAYGRFVRGDLEGALELGERALAAAEAMGVDGSGLPERAAGERLVLPRRTEDRDGVDGAHARLGARRRNPGPPRPRALHEVRRLHEHRRQRPRRGRRRRGARRGRSVRVAHGPGPGRVRARAGARVDRPDRGGIAPAPCRRHRGGGRQPLGRGLRADGGPVAPGPPGRRRGRARRPTRTSSTSGTAAATGPTSGSPSATSSASSPRCTRRNRPRSCTARSSPRARRTRCRSSPRTPNT